MNNFLPIYYLTKLKQNQISNLNTPSEIFQRKNKSSVPDGFNKELYQIFKEELMPILLKLFHKIETKGIIANLFYEASYPDTQTR